MFSLDVLFSWIVYTLAFFNLVLLLLNVGLRLWSGRQTGPENNINNNTNGGQEEPRTQQQNHPGKRRRTSNDADFSPEQFNASFSPPQRPDIIHPTTNRPAVVHKLLAVMGSGGHTTEMLKLLASTASDNMFPVRVYVMADSDQLSARKVADFEQTIASAGNTGNTMFRVHKIPRAREVGQSYASSVWTTLVATWHSMLLVLRERPDIILSNGPAIGLPICVFARLLELLFVHRCRIVFVESICRVRTLSLTGRLLYHLRIPHAFLVQWAELLENYPRAEFIGRLI